MQIVAVFVPVALLTFFHTGFGTAIIFLRCCMRGAGAMIHDIHEAPVRAPLKNVHYYNCTLNGESVR